MKKVSPDNLLIIGTVIRPHGLEGLLRIWSYAQSEKSFLDAGTIFLKSGSGKTNEYSLLSVRPHKQLFLMKLKELSSFDEAEKFRGADILIRKGSLRRENEDEFFFVLSGKLLLDLEGDTIELLPHQGFTVPRGVEHRTRAQERTVVLMVEGNTVKPRGDP